MSVLKSVAFLSLAVSSAYGHAFINFVNGANGVSGVGLGVSAYCFFFVVCARHQLMVFFRSFQR